MSAIINRQDLQNVLDTTKNRIVERMLTKRDVQLACENARDRIIAGLHEMYRFEQQATKQTMLQVAQQTQRVAGVEMRMAALEGEVRSMKQLMGQLLEEQRRIAAAMATMPTYIVAATQANANNEAATSPMRTQYGAA